MTVPLKPASDYVVVTALETQTKTASGILLPSSAQEKSKVAKIVAVGRNVADFKVGDRVIYQNEFEATTVNMNGKDYTLVFSRNIIATVEK